MYLLKESRLHLLLLLGNHNRVSYVCAFCAIMCTGSYYLAVSEIFVFMYIINGLLAPIQMLILIAAELNSKGEKNAHFGQTACKICYNNSCIRFGA